METHHGMLSLDRTLEAVLLQPSHLRQDSGTQTARGLFSVMGTFENLCVPTDMVHFDHIHRPGPTISFSYCDLIGSKVSALNGFKAKHTSLQAPKYFTPWAP